MVATVPDAELIVGTFERERFSAEEPGPEEVERALAAAARVREGANRASPNDWS